MTKEWIVFGVSVGVPLLLTLFFCCYKPAQHWAITKLKLCCGFQLRHGELKGTESFYNQEAFEDAKSASAAAKTLLILNTFWSLGGLALFAVSLMSIAGTTLFPGQESLAPVMLFLGAFVTVLTWLGHKGASMDESCVSIAFYFYGCVFIFLGIGVAIGAFFSFKDLLMEKLKEQWESGGYQYFPDEWRNLSVEDAFAKVQDITEKNIHIVLGCLSVPVLSLLVALMCAGKIIGKTDLVRNFVMVSQYVGIFFGLLFLFTGLGTSTTWNDNFIGAGGVLLVASLMGIRAQVCVAFSLPLDSK